MSSSRHVSPSPQPAPRCTEVVAAVELDRQGGNQRAGSPPRAKYIVGLRQTIGRHAYSESTIITAMSSQERSIAEQVGAVL